MTTRQMPAKADEQHGIRPKGYRLPESTHLGRVRLQVADLERSLAFYEKVLGMRVIRRTTDSVSLGPHGENREIVHLRHLRSARPVPKRGLLGLYHFAILLPDRASLGRFVAHLAEIGVYAGMSDHFVSEAIYLTDPDGLGIEVYADRPRDAWRYDERQLHMTTNHLDVDDLVSSARGERWTGMPPGTVLGHVHLYVDDINKAGRSTTKRWDSTKSCGATPARCSCRPVAITIISERIPGPAARRRRRTRMRVCSSGR